MREVKEENGEENLDSDKHLLATVKHWISNSFNTPDLDDSRNRKA